MLVIRFEVRHGSVGDPAAVRAQEMKKRQRERAWWEDEDSSARLSGLAAEAMGRRYSVTVTGRCARVCAMA